MSEKRRGRPPEITRDHLVAVCGLIADGASGKKACESVGISKASFFNHISKDKDILDLYGKALESKAETLFDEIIEISDNPGNETVQRDRLKIDARKWVVVKMLPQKYGDKISQEITGAGGGPVDFKFVDPPQAKDTGEV